MTNESVLRSGLDHGGPLVTHDAGQVERVDRLIGLNQVESRLHENQNASPAKKKSMQLSLTQVTAYTLSYLSDRIFRLPLKPCPLNRSEFGCCTNDLRFCSLIFRLPSDSGRAVNDRWRQRVSLSTSPDSLHEIDELIVVVWHPVIRPR